MRFCSGLAATLLQIRSCTDKALSSEAHGCDWTPYLTWTDLLRAQLRHCLAISTLTALAPANPFGLCWGRFGVGVGSWINSDLMQINCTNRGEAEGFVVYQLFCKLDYDQMVEWHRLVDPILRWNWSGFTPGLVVILWSRKQTEEAVNEYNTAAFLTIIQFIEAFFKTAILVPFSSSG